MTPADHRHLVSSLADDLGWLEDHCRRQVERSRETVQLRVAAGLVRNVVGPWLDGQPPTPLHIAVVGGAGAGKSTIVNFLVGKVVAEANPQAGYTRHSTAYVRSGSNEFSGHLGFLGPLQRLDRPAPGNLDQDVYQVRTVDGGDAYLGDVVIWDCPDMTTWAAEGYVPRLAETASLADVIVYVASDERYNDESPTQFLNDLVKTGKPVVAVITKMNPQQADAIVEHFRQEVLTRLPLTSDGRTAVPVIAVPYLTVEQLNDPVARAGPYRIPLLNQVRVLADGPDARRRSVSAAVRYLTAGGDGLLKSARQDLAATEEWREAVFAARVEFENRYRSEFLSGEGFRRFDDARDRLLELLELPGAGRGFASVMWVLRFPYRMLRSAVAKMMVRPPGLNTSEPQVIDEAFRAWLDRLRVEALKKADQHALWKHAAAGFKEELAQQSRDQFGDHVRRFDLGSGEEIESAARAVTSGLEQNPSALVTLRGLKLLSDITAFSLALWAGWFNWLLLLFIPLFLSIAHQLVELMVRQFVEARRTAVRDRKMTLVRETIAQPTADWLAQWPITGGSTFEKLDGVLRRVPADLKQLQALVETRLRS